MDALELFKAAGRRGSPPIPDPAERKRLRQATGVPLAVTAAAVGCDVASLKRWERGDNDPRNFVVRQRYARVLAAMRAAQASEHSLDGAVA